MSTSIHGQSSKIRKSFYTVLYTNQSKRGITDGIKNNPEFQKLRIANHGLLTVKRKPTNDNWMAVYSGVTGSGESVSAEVVLEIVADSQAEATRQAAQIWGLELDSPCPETFEEIDTRLRRYGYTISRDIHTESNITLRRDIGAAWLFERRFHSRKELIDFVGDLSEGRP